MSGVLTEGFIFRLGSVEFSVKGQVVNILGFAGQQVSDAVTTLQLYSRKATTDNTSENWGMWQVAGCIPDYS